MKLRRRSRTNILSDWQVQTCVGKLAMTVQNVQPRATHFIEQKGCEMAQNLAGIVTAMQGLTVIALGFECR